MSLFSDIANALGNTVENMAQDIGASVSDLEVVVNDLNSYGVDVFSMSAKLGLSPVSFLRNITGLMNSDPHQELLQHLTGAVKPMEEPLSQLSQQLMQMATLHENTAQAINEHINDLFQSGGTNGYSGPAADTLWETNQNYQEYFSTVLVNHAQVQQTRHATLSGSVSEYLTEMPGKVYSYSAPMAAFGVLTLDTASFAPPRTPAPPSGLQQTIDWTEQSEQELEQYAEDVPPGPEDPIWDFWAILIVLLFLFLIILVVINWIAGLFNNHQSQQSNTTTPKPTPSPSPTPILLPGGLTPAQQQEVRDIIADATKEGLVFDQRDVEALVRAGYDRDTILAMLRAGNLQRSQGKSYTTPGGHVYPAHTENHIGVSDADLKDLTSKNNKAGGKSSPPRFLMKLQPRLLLTLQSLTMRICKILFVRLSQILLFRERPVTRLKILGMDIRETCAQMVRSTRRPPYPIYIV